MGWLDQIPRAGKLYIGGLHALYQKPDLFSQAGITHIISVLDFDIYETGHFSKYEHIHIRQEDDPNEDLLQHFKSTNAFIEHALTNGGGVFVHCAMGKSRSATICCAYLMGKYGVSPTEALAQICEGRPVCSPNLGFMEQLDVYHRMLEAKDDREADRIHRTWLDERYIGDPWTWEARKKAIDEKVKTDRPSKL